MRLARIIRQNGKLYDIKTPNKSFRKVALDLRKTGRKNWYFMLEIQNVGLLSIDPYEEDEKTGRSLVSDSYIEQIIFECKNNPWYYLREIARVEEPGLPHGIPYAANRGNIAQAWCLLHGLDSWLCLPRQQGKTISALELINWAYSFGTTNSTFIFVNKDIGNAKDNLQRLGTMIDLLPEYLRFQATYSEEEWDENGNVTKTKVVKAKRNATSMWHPVTKNRIMIKPKATSYATALSLARGMTSPLIHYDEPEFTEHIDTIIKNSVSTFQTAADHAKENGAIYGRLFTCTNSRVCTLNLSNCGNILLCLNYQPKLAIA